MTKQLYRKIEPLEEGVLVNYVGVHVTQWKPSMGLPTVGFAEADQDEYVKPDSDPGNPVTNRGRWGGITKAEQAKLNRLRHMRSIK